LANTRNILDTKKGKASTGNIKIICLQTMTTEEEG